MGKVNRVAFWLVVAALPVQAGCLALAAGTAVGGAATAGYFYFHGLLYRDYEASLVDTLAATRAALADLHFRISEEKPETGGATIVTHTTDNATIRIFLEVAGSRIPAEAPVTRVGVRVGFTGDDGVSQRILDQVTAHLAPPQLRQAAPQTVTPQKAPPLAPAPAAPPETAAPPLVAPAR